VNAHNNVFQVKHSFFILFIVFTFITGCAEINTSEPEEVYSHWTNGASSTGVELLKGKYWQSAHWTKEYVMYLELRPSKDWWKNYKEINGFESHRIDKVDVAKSEIMKVDAPDWAEKPDWFVPDKNCEVYGQFGGSKYFWNPGSGILFIYEIQL
jgi:hypothetical protein